MKKIHAAITGIQGYVPDYVLDNKELEKLVDTNDEWIVSRTGIKDRRILKGVKGSSDLGAEAIKGLLKKTNTSAEEIDLIICATVTPDMLFPSTACLIANKIGAGNICAFDISAACSGFLYALTTASKFIESGSYKKVIVVGCDKMSSIIDYTDRTTCVLFGDGAGAALLEPNTDGYGIMDYILKSDQGLIPFKTLSFSKGVNFTAGLEVIRTSPVHGVAYDIAGKNRANSDSFKAAIYNACDIFLARNI